jgi:2-(1,2-epoxy-1,2-dihydrophenyl)acetyl-CoA isomerase
MDQPELLEQHHDGVLTLTLNRPGRKNAVTRDMVVMLNAALRRAAGDPAVRAIVLTGAGDAFCAGGDMLQQGADTVMLLHRMGKPSVAVINGVAAGGGLALAAACDIRLCGASARFTFAYPKLGLSGDFGASYLMEKLLGTSRAR